MADSWEDEADGVYVPPAPVPPAAEVVAPVEEPKKVVRIRVR